MAVRGKAILLGLLAMMAVAGVAPAVGATPEQAVSAATVSQSQPSYRLAQLNLNFGLTRDDARRLLFESGYLDIQVTRTSFKNVRAQACLNGIRYEVKVRRLSGRVIRGKRIGKCRRAYDAQEIAVRLKRQGLDKISVSPVGRERFVAKACDYDQRVRLDIDRYGEVIQRAVTGRCQRGPNVAEIKRQLKKDGFTKIKVVERNPGRLIVQACISGDKVRLRLAQNGRIQRQDIIGTCQRPIRPQNIARTLNRLGYSRVTVIDDQLPVYKAEACRQNSLMRVRMNRYGEVISASRLGPCSPPLTRQQIVQMLQRRGANRVEIVSSNSRGFRATACYRLERREYRIDPYGAILNRQTVGRCEQAPRLNSVLDNFRSRGMRNVRILVEGCRNGRRLQIELNQFGDEINRRRIGRC